MPESPANDAKQAAGAAKGTASAAKGAVTTVKAVATVAKAGSGPAGWIMLAKQFAPQIQALASKLRKAAAVAAAYLLYLLWLLLQKILGIIAGLAFGAITGIPLLFIPGVGPFLYVGYVGFWGYRGMVDPASTIHLATHPWEAITKPISWVNDKIFNLGSATKGGVEYVGGGIGQGVSGAISGIGNFVAGAASGIWNAAVGAVGNAIGWGSSLLSGGFNLLSTGATAATATIAKVAVGGAIGTITTVSIVSSITTNTAFSSPEGDPENFTPPGENADFIVAKTAQPTSVSNPGPDVTFTITLTAKSQAIADVGFVDNFRYQKDGVETSLTPLVPTFTCSLPINAGNSCTNQFNYKTALAPPDSLLINTALASVTLADGTNKQESATVSVPIGAPITSNPSGWPTCGYIAQGPYQGPTHNHFRSMSAVDVQKDDGMGDNVYATHEGVVSIMRESSNPSGGNGVIVTGANYATLYAHFGAKGTDSGWAPGISQGVLVNAGALLGYRGNSGNAILPHVHYSILDTSLNDIPLATFLTLVPPFNNYDTVPSTWGPCE